MMQTDSITIAHGDGIGPEIMAATLRVLEAAGARLELRTIEMGERAYKRGCAEGIDAAAWDVLKTTQVLLKAPITTPQGGGYKSLNVALRKHFGLYANVRPCVAYAPFIATQHPQMNLVVIRENEEDVYTGIEYQQSADVRTCLKIITRPGCERIVRYAFEYARLHGRRKVTCLSKDNIMKMTDGLFHATFVEIGKAYPDIEQEHLIVDIGAARIATVPERFDVVLMPNLYGDIISDITAEMTGSVGLVGTANIGTECAMFEAIHGSAPLLAGKDCANPSSLLLAAVQMLVHIGQIEPAEGIHNAWLRTIEDGVGTPDITKTGAVGTQGFADAVIQRLGESPRQLPVARYVRYAKEPIALYERPNTTKAWVGIDVFIEDARANISQMAERIQACAVPDFKLQSITNRGLSVWPRSPLQSACVDQYCCRLMATSVTLPLVLGLLQRLGEQGFEILKTEHLYTFDGKPGFSNNG